jgi:hypothetical protein
MEGEGDGASVSEAEDTFLRLQEMYVWWPGPLHGMFSCNHLGSLRIRIRIRIEKTDGWDAG